MEKTMNTKELLEKAKKAYVSTEQATEIGFHIGRCEGFKGAAKFDGNREMLLSLMNTNAEFSWDKAEALINLYVGVNKEMADGR